MLHDHDMISMTYLSYRVDEYVNAEVSARVRYFTRRRRRRQQPRLLKP